MIFCQNCGTPGDGSYCGECGTKMSATPMSSLPEISGIGNFPPSSPEATNAVASEKPACVSGAEDKPVNNESRSRFATSRGRASRYSPKQRDLSLEMRFVMFAFLSAGIIGALLVLIAHVSGVSDITRFPNVVSNRVLNMFVGMLSYVPTMAVVPIALFLLARTGQSRSVLGIGIPSWKEDIIPGIGIGAAAFGVELLLMIPFAGVLKSHPGLITSVADSSFPKYYLLEAIFMSAVSAVTEEVLVNGYFLTRLQQLGWNPRSALIVSLIFRTSYHIYYGVGFIFTIPLGYFVTRSFQKHQKLNRPIWAHFLYDAILFSITIFK